MKTHLLVLLVLAAVLGGCRVEGLQFVHDRRVEWLLEDRSVAQLPLTLRWELDGYEMVGADGSSRDDAGYVAILIDRQPPQPFARLDALAEDDDSCRPEAGCPDLQWFNDRGIYPVEQGTSLVVDRLPLPSRPDRREVRTFTLILLDGEGRRQGESAFRLILEIDRDGAIGPADLPIVQPSSPPASTPSSTEGFDL